MNPEPANTPQPDWLEPIKARLATTQGTWQYEPVAEHSNIIPLHLDATNWQIVTDQPDKHNLVTGLGWYDGDFLALTTKYGEFIANAPSDVKRLIGALEETVWLIEYGEMTYLARGHQLLGSYNENEVDFNVIDNIACRLGRNVRHADGSQLFADRLGDTPHEEGFYLEEWLLNEGPALLEQYALPETYVVKND